MLTELATLDAILAAYATELGRDFTLYRNHAYRVANLCACQLPQGAEQPVPAEQHERIAIAAAFHDLGIWTDSTFDYLAPSVWLASAHLTATGKAHWIPEITGMILEHHKILRYGGDAGPLVEPFRRADWIDVTRGLLAFGVPRRFIAALYARWPGAGFHRRLVQLELAHLRKDPLRPLPVLKL